MKIIENNIYNMDCIDGMKLLEDNSIDLIVTSPPYDGLRQYDGAPLWDFNVFNLIANEVYQKMADGGVVVWIVNDACVDGSETCTSFKQALYFKDIGFKLHDTMIWEKDTFTFPDVLRYGQCFEYMFIFSKGKPKTVNKICDRQNKWADTLVHGTSRGKDGNTFRKSNDGKTTIKEFGERFNVWHIDAEKDNKSNHPAVFPEQLVRDHISTWSNIGDLVLDPFSGSGTTAFVAKKLHRRYIGFEISKNYYEASLARMIGAVSLSVEQKENDKVIKKFDFLG